MTISFEERKKEHIEFSLKEKNQALDKDLDHILLEHEALPGLNFDEIDIKRSLWGVDLKSPFYVSSMTAGHGGSFEINKNLARACEDRGWLLGVGSQRGQLKDPSKKKEWQQIRKEHPKVSLLGNIGISQLSKMSLEELEEMIHSLGGKVVGFCVHTNPLQECLQKEGTPFFKGDIEALKKFSKSLKVPFVLKETGCGFSYETLKKIKKTKVKAVDVSGLGGTHWGRVEGDRSGRKLLEEASKSFSNWGVSTVESVILARKLKPSYEIWASGGVRTGVDAAKFLALGASMVGLAQPLLKELLEKGVQGLQFKMELLEYELKTAMFCMGIPHLKGFQRRRFWKWKNKRF